MKNRRTSRSLSLPLLTVLACCTAGGDSSPPGTPPPGHLVAGVQIWNGTKQPIRCRAALVSSTGERVELAKDLAVPNASAVTNPSLGGDPNAVREVTGSVPPGTWTFVVEAGGHTGRLTASWPAASWAIVFVGADGLRLAGDSAPRRLE